MDNLLARDFVRLCLAGSWNPQALREAQCLIEAGNLDWDAVRFAARQGFAASLLYAALKDQPFLPPEVGDALRQTYLGWAKRNLYTTAILEQVIAALTAANIDHALLKGAALIPSLYGNMALRPLRDIDLLVRAADVRRAAETVQPLGFHTEMPELRMESTLQYENQLFLARRDTYDVYLELHWQLLDSPHHQQTVPIDWFWGQLEPVSLFGKPARAFKVEAQLLHLCGHLILHHRGKGLLWWNDIAQLLRRKQDSIDWDLLISQARAADLLRPLQETLPVIVQDWYVPLPQEVLHKLLASNPSPDDEHTYEVLTTPGRGPGRRFWDDLLAFPGWRERLAFAAGNLFPSAAYMRGRYGLKSNLLLPFAYPYRWLLGLASFFS